MLKKVEWSDDLLIYIPEIDIQHKKLLQISQDFYNILTGNLENYKLNMAKILKNLTDYTVYHFSSEEVLLKKYNYPAMATHKMTHDNFVTEVSAQIRRLSSGSIENGQRFYEYIISWVLTHIAKADKTWANFVRPKMENNRAN